MGAHDKARLALKLSADRHQLDGAWWPRSRVLAAELPVLLAAWPSDAGYVSRVVCSPTDWEDRPHAVAIPNRRGLLKISSFPPDDSHQMVLTMLDGQRRSLVVIPPDATEAKAIWYLRHFDPRAGRVPGDSAAVAKPT